MEVKLGGILKLFDGLDVTDLNRPRHGRIDLSNWISICCFIPKRMYSTFYFLKTDLDNLGL